MKEAALKGGFSSSSRVCSLCSFHGPFLFLGLPLFFLLPSSLASFPVHLLCCGSIPRNVSCASKNIPEIRISLEVFIGCSSASFSGDAINNISDVTDQRDESSTYYCADFYPGQQVQATARIFKEAKFVSGTKPAISNQGRLTAIIVDVAVDSLDVDWQVCGYTGSQEGSLVQPDAIISRNDLSKNEVKVLNHFNEAHIQIGDKAYYILSEDNVKFCKETVPKSKKDKAEAAASAAAKSSSAADAAEALSNEEDDDSDVETETTQKHGSTSGPGASSRQVGSRPRRRRHVPIQKKKKRYQPPVVLQPGERVCVEVCYTKTQVHTAWQDSSVQENVVSTDLYPVIHLDELEFFPGDFIVDTRNHSSVNKHDLGVVQSADFEARLCTVKWLSFRTSERDKVDEVDLELEESVSVYDMKDHEDYTFRVGDIVVRLSPNDAKDPKDAEAAEEKPNALAPAGQIMKVNKDGTIQVLWVDHSISSVLPSQLYVVNEEDLDWESDSNLSDISDAEWDGEDEWETASEASQSGNEGADEALSDLGVVMRSLNALHTLAANPDGDMNARAAQFITALEEQFSPSDWGASNNLINDIGQRSVIENPTDTNALSSSIPDATSNQMDDEASAAVVENDTAVASGDGASNDNTPSSVEQCVEMAPDHVSFVTSETAPTCHKFASQSNNPINPRTFNSAVMRDIKLLQTDLPRGIIVKVFEDRTDLYSALITGSPGTPYEDGLFYFDIQLPDNYPSSPPQVHYHSYCSSRLNPNLYECGKVCVSLLGTWAGTGSEKWTSKSTLQQLLLSIQGLILNEEPYFNEAGYDKHRTTPEGKENSRMYNEMAVIKMLQSMQLMVTRPPEIFKDEVLEHFGEKADKIVARFDSWLNTCGDGTLGGDGETVVPSFPLFPLSKGFCATISRILEDLRQKFAAPPFR